ncbi:hypothetical protein MHM93_14350 [Pseudoalteromonas sp. MM17-2]|uniref:hypothetical protein n=1 Tax=Pseudoalteromonas sp. MM17-2 TaxID=2917753 RepID=UPI001EF455A6|nr:hypothetical protein [Pseudoalteromonas sp. MM17-2]MCG7545358.1 hypothetical protein [Pseudoalteromonas sp. MM17-2]
MLAVPQTLEINKMNAPLSVQYQFEHLIAQSQELTGEICIDTIRAELSAQHKHMSTIELNEVMQAVEEYVSEYI